MTTRTTKKNLLTDLEVRKAKDGWLNDGAGLHLRTKGASQKWVFRYVRDGKAVEIGCGGADRVSLKMARERREKYLDALAEGLDPRSEKLKEAAGRKTFAYAAEELIKERKKNWRTSHEGRESSLTDWTKSLTVDCRKIANRSVADIDVDDIIPLVKPIWDRGHKDAARRLLKRIEETLHFAKARRWRKGDNPAAWADFKYIFQASGPVKPKDHHPALEWRETPAFMSRLRSYRGEAPAAALALEMMILTASRSGEVRGMLWTEIDFDAAVWTVAPERMKRGRPHEVPLSTDALRLLKRLEPGRINQFVFPGRGNARPVGHWALWNLVQTYTGREEGAPSEASPHGFRSSFRSWARAKRMPDDIAERCLAHQRKDATLAAYDREEMLEDRRVWMERWANFLSGEDSADVVPIRAAS
jgi:integrase